MSVIIDAAVELETCTFEIGRLGDLLAIVHEMIDIVRDQSMKNITASEGRMDLIDSQLVTVERLNRDIRKEVKYWSDMFYECSRQLKGREDISKGSPEEEACKQLIMEHVSGIKNTNHLGMILSFAKAIDEAGEKEKAPDSVDALAGAQE